MRIGVLEMTGGGPSERRLFWSEIAVAAILGLTAIATAWSAYKATVVRDDAASTSTSAIRVLNLGTSSLLHSDELLTRNEIRFLEYRRALESGNQRAVAGELASMRPELRQQVEWWRRQPRGKYPSPFVADDPFYRAPYLVGGRQARRLSQELFKEGDRVTNEANRYELMTVVLACGLFLLGVAAVVKSFTFRLALLGIGTLFLVGAAVALVWLGVRDVHFECRKFLQDVEHACD